MEFSFEELKKDKRTAHLTHQYEHLLGEEKKIKEMLEKDSSLEELVTEEL